MYADRDDRISIRRFSPSGEPARATELSGIPSSAHAVGGGLEVAYVVRVSQRAPGDRMGLLLARVAPDGTTRGAPRPLSPLDAEDSHPGSAAWSGERVAAVYTSRDGSVSVRVGEAVHTLSRSWRRGGVDVAAFGDAFLATWPDHRDDRSPACTDRAMCVSEIYVALVDVRGAPRGVPVRITTDARPEPVPVVDEGWERWCPEP